MNVFKNDVGRPSNKVKRIRNIIKTSLILASVIFIVLLIYTVKNGVTLFSLLNNKSNNLFAEKLNTSEETKDKVYEVRDAVLKTANAYYKQGEQIQYDTYKRNLSCTPEDATSKHYCYVNCSGFVHMVYKNAIGKEVPDTTIGLFDYAANKFGKSDTVIAYSSDLANNYKNGYYKERLGSFFLDNIKNIKPGDVIVWKTNSAHTMLVESVDEKNNEIHIIQAGGGAAETEGRYDVELSKDMYETEGALSKETIKVINNVAMIGSNGKYVEVSRKQIAILRFATSYDYEKITGASKIRQDFPNIYVAKVASSDNQNFVREKGTITYTLKVKNNSKDTTYRDIVIKENLDENEVEVKSITFKNETKYYKNYKKESNQKDIIRNISELKPGEEVILKYTVELKDNIGAGRLIVSTGIVGKINKDKEIYGIKSSRIETLVGKGLTYKEKTSLYSISINPIQKIKEIYKEEKKIKNSNGTIETVAGVDLDKIKSVNDIIDFKDNIKNNSSGLVINYTNFKNNSIKNYLYSNYYGLRIAEKSVSGKDLARAHGAWNQNTSYESYDRARTLTPNMLTDGDAIITGNVVYIFYNKALYNLDGSKAKLLGKKLDEKTNKIIEEKISLEVFLRDLIGKDYVILRLYTK